MSHDDVNGKVNGDLVSREWLFDEIGKNYLDADNYPLHMRKKIQSCCAYANDIVESAPAVDAAPVVHGRWIYHVDYLFPTESTRECSVCHKEEFMTLRHENYCPNCGAKMDGEE